MKHLNFLSKTRWLLVPLMLITLGIGQMWGDSVTMSYSGSTTTNMGNGNNASSVGLNASSWNVAADKGGNSNYPGLNKSGYIALYYNATASNTITVSNSAGATINSISITYTSNSYNNGVVKVGSSTVSPSSGSYTINASSFSITNGNTSNVQVRISSITINYTPSGSTPQTTALSEPTGMSSGTPGQNSTTLSWNAVAHADGYALTVGTNSPITSGFSTSAGVVSYNLTGLNPDTKYTWKVKATTTHTDTYSNSADCAQQEFTTQDDCTGEKVTYTVSSTSAVNKDGTAPAGASATYSSTYGTAKQLTKDNSMTLTLSGYEGYIIKSIKLSMKSNGSSGSGNFSAVAGSTTISSIATAAFNTASWYGAWSTSYVKVVPAMSNANYVVKEGENIVITIAATANSLYCESFSICYEEAPSHTLGSAVNPTGKATVTLGATSVKEGKTTTATYSDITAGYEFANWSIAGTGASLSSTSTNPTTVTMGSANATVTANLQCITPTITPSGHPASANYVKDAEATALSVGVSQTGNWLGYQWQSSSNGTDWTNIQNATNSTYTPSTGTAGTMYYRVIVRNTATGCSTSATSNAATINVSDIPTCATPAFSPTAGTYHVNQSVAISCETQGASVYYTMTTDGSDPATPTSESSLYSDPISLSSNGTYKIKAIAIKEGANNSTVASATYTIALPRTVTLHAGSGTSAASVAEEAATYGMVTLPEATPSAACATEGWTFAGWATASCASTTTPPTLYPAGSYDPSNGLDLYAVYSKEEENGTSEETVSVSISEYASAHSWAGNGSPQVGEIPLNSDITASTNTNGNNGKYYTDWRLYQSDGGTLTLTAASGCTLKKTAITYGYADGGVLLDGATTISSNDEISISGSSKSFEVGNSGNATNGKVKITAISVTYDKPTMVTYYQTAPECCANVVTITKGANSEHGSFTIDKANGDYLTCAGAVEVVVTPTPDTHYRVNTVSATTGETGIDNGDGTWTITYAQNTNASSTINVSFILKNTYKVTWNVNGDESNKSDVYDGEQPEFPATSPTSCDDEGGSEAFIGWADAAWTGKKALNEVTAHIYTSASELPLINGAAVTYHAVFAKLNPGSQETLINEEFDNTSSSDATGAFDGSTFANFSGLTDKAYKSQYGGVKLGSGSGAGYITSKDLDLSSAFSVSIDACKYGSDAGNIVVTIDEGGEGKEQTIANSSLDVAGTFKTFKLDFAAATATSTIEISTSEKRAYIDNVVVKAGEPASYSEYMTTCCTKYAVNIANGITNGTVTPSPASACEGATITLTFTPSPAYHLSEWTLGGVEQDLAVNTFTMPGEAVTVSATFEHDPCKNLKAPTLNGDIVKTYNSATINWNAVVKTTGDLDVAENGVTGYLVTVTKNGAANPIFSGNVNALTKALSELEAETQYNYSIMAVGDGTDYCATGNGVLEGNFTTNALPTAHLTLIDIAGTHAFSGDYTILTPFNLPTSAATCSKEFYGWTATENYSSEDVAPEYKAGDDFTFADTEDVTLHAVYAIAEGVSANAALNVESYASDNSWTNETAYISLTINDVTFTANGGGNNGKYYTSNNSWRLYNGGSLSISAPRNIISVSSTPSIDFTISGTSASYDFTSKVEFTSITVIFEGEPTYSEYSTVCLQQLAAPTGLTAGTYYEAQTITLSATNEAAIYYSLDGNDPTIDAQHLYSEPFTLSERTTTTVKAIAVKSGFENSEVAEAEYNINLPYDFADFFALTKENNKEYAVSGVICSKGSLSGTKLTYDISADGSTTNTVTCYKGLKLNKAAFESADDVNLGDNVTVVGTWSTHYTNLNEDNWMLAYAARVVQGYEIVGDLTAYSFVVGETFNSAILANLSVNRIYTSGYKEAVDGVTFTYGEKTNWQAEDTQLAVTANLGNVELTTRNFEVNVDANTLVSIALKADDVNYQTKKVYYFGDAFVAPTIVATLSNESTIEAVATYVSGFNNANAGVQEITVSYTRGAITETTSYNITMKKVFDNEDAPHTVAEANEMITAVGTSSASESYMWLRGIVCGFNGTSVNQYYISDDGTETGKLYVYNGKYFDNESFDANNKLHVGDVVILKAKIQIYSNTTNELVSSVVTYQLREGALAIEDVAMLGIGAEDLAEGGLDVTRNGSNGAITFESGNTSVLTIVDNKLHAVNIGDAEVTATMAATNNSSSINFTAASATFNVHVSFAPSAQIAEIGGKFVINQYGDTAVFSRGNLQYNQATKTWRTAVNQFDWQGTKNLEMGNPEYNDWVDLFCWSIGEENNYGATSAYHTSLYYNKPFVDWGGLFTGDWSTLSIDEWYYMLYTRANANNLWGMAMIGDNLGMILLPEGWTAPSGVTFVPGTIPTTDMWKNEDCLDPTQTNKDHWRLNPDNLPANKFTQDEWAQLEAAGAVFMPYAGRRSGGYGNHTDRDNQTVDYEYAYSYYENYYGAYWTSKVAKAEEGKVYWLPMICGGCDANHENWGRGSHGWWENGRYGHSVRLVHIIPRQYSVTYDANGATIGSVPTDGSKYLKGEEVTVAGKGNLKKAGYTFAGWKFKNQIYQAGETYTISGVKYNEEIVFVAQWEALPVWATTYTSNVTMSGETAATVIIEGKSYTAQKAGSGSAAGNVDVAIPAGATTVHFHASAWKDKEVTLNITAPAGITVTPASVSLIADAGVSGSGTDYTLANDPSTEAYFAVSLSGNTDAFTLNFANTGSGKQFVLYGVNAIYPEITLDPALYDFANVRADQQKQQVFTITANEVVSGALSATLLNNESGKFSVSAIEDNKVTVTFAPDGASSGDFSAQLKISASNASVTADLTGTAIAADAPEIVVNKNAVAFGRVNPNAEVSDAIAVQLLNVAAVNADLSGDDAAKFGLSANELTESGDLVITPNTTENGVFSATLTLSATCRRCRYSAEHYGCYQVGSNVHE